MDGPHVEKTCGIWKSVWEVAMVVFYVFMWTQISKEIKCILPCYLWTIFKTWQNVNFKKIKWIKKITSMQTMIKGRWARISLWLEAPVILSVNFETKLSPPFKQKNKYLISLNCDKHILKNNHKSAKILNVSFIVYKYIGICSIVWMTDIPVLVVQGGPFKTW